MGLLNMHNNNNKMSKIIKREKFPRREGKKQFVLITIQYEFLEELWRVIKEYAGVYDVKINWDVGVARLTGAMGNIFNIRWKNAKAVAANELKEAIKKWFWKGIRNNNTWKGVKDEYNEKNKSKKGVLELMVAELSPKAKKEKPEGLEVGQDVYIYDHNHIFLCRIEKVNKLYFIATQYIYTKIEGEEVIDNIKVTSTKGIIHINYTRQNTFIWLKDKPWGEKIRVYYSQSMNPYSTKLYIKNGDNLNIFDDKKEKYIRIYEYSREETIDSQCEKLQPTIKKLVDEYEANNGFYYDD